MSEQWHYEQKGESYIKVDTLHKIRTLESELAAVTEQRDRLADVLRMTPLDLHPADSQGLCLCSQCEFRFAAASALQSLNPDHTVEPNDMIAAVKGGADE